MRYLARITPPIIILLILFFGTACTPLIGPYTLKAYENATSLKVETLAIMDKATTPYTEQKITIEAVELELQKAYEYVNGIPHNDLSATQWKILIDPEGDLIGKFFRRWKEHATLNKVFIHEYKKIISDAFDEIICLEANKKEPSTCKKRSLNVQL